MPILLTFLTFEVCASIGIFCFLKCVSSLQEKVLNSSVCFQSVIWKLKKHLRVCGFCLFNISCDLWIHWKKNIESGYVETLGSWKYVVHCVVLKQLIKEFLITSIYNQFYIKKTNIQTIFQNLLTTKPLKPKRILEIWKNKHLDPNLTYYFKNKC
jgi:hypothetical protein